ncbi:MAG: diguanylate cyclase, partial [Magnetococcales bacterium]|nr:diguanylate cyclase [Magnetococcales bacterium]
MNNATPTLSTAELEKLPLFQDNSVFRALSQRMTRINAIISRRSQSAAQLAREICRDEMLANAVLHFSDTDTSHEDGLTGKLKRAIVLHGFNRIRTLGIELAFFDAVVERIGLPHAMSSHFWRHSMMVAILSRALAKSTQYKDHNIAYLAGLLHDIGKLPLYLAHTETYESLLDVTSHAELSIADQERKLFGVGHDTVGAHILKQCGFSDRLCCAVDSHHQRYESSSSGEQCAHLTVIVQVADFIAWTQGAGSWSEKASPMLPARSEKYIDLDHLNVPGMIAHSTPKLQQAAERYQFSLPNNRKIKGNLFQANLNLARLRSQYLELKEEKDLAMAREKRAKILLLPHQSLNPETIFKTTLKAIKKDMPFDEVWLFHFIKQTRSMVAEVFPGAASFDPEWIGHQFSISPKDQSVLASLRLRKPVKIDGRTPLEDKLLKMVGLAKGVVMPIAGQERIHGVALLVQRVRHKPVDLHEMEDLTALFHEIGVALDNARHLSRANRKASTDKLTGLMNRGSLDEYVSSAFNRALREKSDLAMVMVDIDYFKKFNDRFGHQEGDRVLELVAPVIKKSIRADGVVGRYGGEEFLLVLNNTNLQQAMACCERVRNSVAKLGHSLNKRFPGRPLSISLGVAA